MRVYSYESALNMIADGINLATIATGIRSGYQSTSFLHAPDTASFQTLTHRAWKIAKTTGKAIVLVENLSTTTLLTAGIGLAAINIIGGIRSRNWEIPTKIYNLTPSLIVITDIALLALEFQYNPAKVYFAVGAIALTILTPDRMAQLPLYTTVFSFWYGGLVLKTEILAELAGNLFVKPHVQPDST